MKKVIIKLFILTVLLISISSANIQGFWDSFINDSSEQNTDEYNFIPIDFTIINSSNIWGETEPCG